MLQFRYLRRLIQQHQSAALEREVAAACHRPGVSMDLLRSGLTSALDAAEGLFFASIISTFIWSLLIFTITRRH